jgi:DNA ligase 1
LLLAEVVAASEALAATSSRKAKGELVAGLLRAAAAGGAPGEVEAVAAWLSGDLRQRQIGVGWRALQELPAAAPVATLEVAEVDAAFGAIGALAGPGSVAARRDALGALLGRATAAEQRWLRALLTGGLRQGALAGVVADGIARAAGLPRAAVDRAVLLRGDAPAVAAVALAEGQAGLDRFRLEVGRGLAPMLAAPAASLEAAYEKAGGAALVEWKLDGARLQVHRDGDDVRIFSRSLDDLTDRLPGVAAWARGLPGRSAVLDGEAMVFGSDGRPAAFQVTASRVASGGEGVQAVLFDVLHRDGQDLLDAPLRERRAALEGLVGEAHRAAGVVAADAAAARAHFDAALAAGHEGVMVKALDAPYAAGRRGAGWLKVKPRHTLDLVVLAAEWGHGRRTGRLSNLHLGARDGDGLVMLGKTFKGLTDEMLAWQTQHLLALERRREGITVHVEPSLVVEVAFDGVQASTRYLGGVALRFARVLHHRPDKRAAEADTLETVRRIHRGEL